MHRILIADDHAVVRRGLREILVETLHGVVLGEARNADEVQEAVRKENWDLVILDMGLPGKSGLESLAQIKLLRPKVPVLFLSVHPEEQYAVRVLKAGGAGYLTKDSAPTLLVEAVRRVLKGGRYVSPKLAEILANRLLLKREGAPWEALSNREMEILRMLGSGKMVTQIARELGLSVKTISTYRSRTMTKLGVDSTAGLIRYVLEHDLID